MADKVMYIPNNPINQNLIKVPKVNRLANKERLFKNLGTSVINSPFSTSSLGISSLCCCNNTCSYGILTMWYMCECECPPTGIDYFIFMGCAEF